MLFLTEKRLVEQHLLDMKNNRCVLLLLVSQKNIVLLQVNRFSPRYFPLMCRINNMDTSGLRRLHLCFFYLVSHKILIRLKVGLGFSINKNSVSYLVFIVQQGMVLGDIHVLTLAHIYEMWIFYFPINHNNTSLSPYGEIHLMFVFPIC